MSISRRVLMWGLMAACTASAGACRRSPESDTSGTAPLPDIDFQRHLRQGKEQMRRGLYTNAAAELNKCRRSRPDDAELLFQLARLQMAQEAGLVTVVSLLQKALAADGGMIRAHRFLYVAYTLQGRKGRAAIHRDAVERLAGPLGSVEMDATDYHLGWRSQAPDYTQRHPSAGEDDDQVKFAEAARRLERLGEFDPHRAVPAMEEVFRANRDLPALRLFYARKLAYRGIRILAQDRPELPPISSRLIMDYAQMHFEHAIDQAVPTRQVAGQCIEGLADVAMNMADYDDAVVHNDNLIAIPQLPEAMRLQFLAQKGVARYKQHRYDEAIAMLELSLIGMNRSDRAGYGRRWNLHLAYDAAGIPVAQRAKPFRFRRGLAMPGAEAPLQFKDVAAAWGVNKLDGLGPSAWCDYDRDGDSDLFVCGCDSYGALYRNDGDRFQDVSNEAKLFHVQSGFSATFQDYDNDGYCDLYVGRDGWNGPVPNSLYHNNGDGTFVDVTQQAGVGHAGSSFVHAWLDYNRDGHLDLYVANGIMGDGSVNTLYHNNGNGTFTDATQSAGLREASGTKTIGFAVGDYDADGWSDIFVGGYNTAHRLYHNLGNGTFEEVAERSGLTSPPWETERYVSFFFDYDNDTWPDILMTRLALWPDVVMGLSEDFDEASPEAREHLLRQAPKLYRNNGDGTFSDVSAEAGFLYPIGVMGANVADVDNDGYQDVYFATGDPEVARMDPDRFFRNNGDGTFTDWTFAAGLGNLGKGHGVTFADIDRDGDLDMYVPEGGFVHGDAWENAFYLNLQATDNRWLHLELEGVKCNRDAVGTRVLVTAGGMSQLRELKGGRGFGSSDSHALEFGLAGAETVERLEVRWPSGTLQVFEGIPVNRRLYLREGETWRVLEP